MSYQPYYPQPYPPAQPPGYGYPQRASAPFSVHVVAFFIYLGGVFALVGTVGFAALAAGAVSLPTGEFPEQYQRMVAGIAVVGAVVLGILMILYFLIARKLQRGRQWARVLVLIFSTLGLLGSIVQIVLLVQAGADGAMIGASASSLIGPLLFMLLLNTSAARSWFKHRTY
ncbi:MAG: hypothetical protein ACRDUA_00605 [Micromonosporaceae bacterium]